MATLSGQDGKMSVGGTDLVLITKWDASLMAEIEETTNLDSSGYQEFAVCDVKGGTASVEGFLDTAAGSLAVGSVADTKLYVGTSSYIGGSAIVKSVKVGSTAKELVKVSYELQFTGTITEATGALT